VALYEVVDIDGGVTLNLGQEAKFSMGKGPIKKLLHVVLNIQLIILKSLNV